MATEFEQMMRGQVNLLHPEELVGPLEEAKLLSLRLRAGLDETCSDKVAETLISTGIYTHTFSFSEFAQTKYTLFKTLSKLHRETILEKGTKSKETYGSLSAIGKSMGILSGKEVEATKGLMVTSDNYLWPEDYENAFIEANCSVHNVGWLPEPNNQEDAIKLIERFRNYGFIICIYFGVFDMIHEGHQDTVTRAREVLGNNSIIMAGVAPDRLSEITKDKLPKRNQGRRTTNMKLTKGVDIAFPVVLPGEVETEAQAIEFFTQLHKEIGAHIRIAGHPNTTDERQLSIYREQCRQSSTLLLLNDNYLDVSSTNERVLST